MPMQKQEMNIFQKLRGCCLNMLAVEKDTRQSQNTLELKLDELGDKVLQLEQENLVNSQNKQHKASRSLFFLQTCQ